MTRPAYIARDTHTGRWSVTCRPGARRTGVFTAAELAANAAESVVWTFQGHVNGGRELYSRERYVALEDGSLAVYARNGSHVITHPADRRLRVLTA